MAAKKLGVVWFTLSLVCIAVAVKLVMDDWLLGALFGWPGGVYFVAGATHYWWTDVGVMILGKDREGRLSWFSIFVFAPYFAVVWFVWGIRAGYLTFLKGEDKYNMVAPHLYVGRYPFTVDNLPPSIDLIVDLTAEFPAVYRSGVTYLNIPCLDTDTPEPDVWAAAVEFACSYITADKTVFVHCAYGHGRSGITAALVLVALKQADSIEHALPILTKSRPCIAWHSPQVKAAEEVIRCLQADAPGG
eukprot:TRINITY_DN9350_c0_g1_i2.p1 TRINITY_DN9350_c0_g1~~TRINITY_DN9350_c0_g1_i2.p1  ORF type:complete len:246 (+),score=43.43 TRINITY_DN9350_c0_g1_i2:184-921(+)